MKTFLILFILSASLLSYGGAGDIAGGGNAKSWSEIHSDRWLKAEAPQVIFGSYRIPILKTCTPDRGITLKTVHKVTIFPEESNYGNGDNFLLGYRKKWDKKYLTTPVKHKKWYCRGHGDNCEFESYEDYYPLKLKIPVRKVPFSDKHEGRLLFKKEFVVPDCEELKN